MCKVQFNQSDVIVMVETWLNKNDAVNFDKFNVIANIASEEFHTLGSKNEVRRRRAFGILCLQRQSSRDNVTVPCKFISSSVETIPNGIVPSKMQLVHLELQWSFANDMTSDKNIIALYVVYIPVQAKRAQILSFLRKNVNFKENLMFVGDINVSFVDNSSIKNLFTNSDMSNLLYDNDTNTFHSTTWDYTHIDWCFANNCSKNKLYAMVGANIFSHHRPIVVSVFDTETN